MSEAKRMTDAEVADVAAELRRQDATINGLGFTSYVATLLTRLAAERAQAETRFEATVTRCKITEQAYLEMEARALAAEAQLCEAREALEAIKEGVRDGQHCAKIASDTLARLNQIATPSV